MNETMIIWTNIFVYVLAVSYVLTDFIANKPSDKIRAAISLLILLIVTTILVVLLYMVATGIYQGTVMFTVAISAILLIVRKEFLQNIKETILIVERKTRNQ